MKNNIKIKKIINKYVAKGYKKDLNLKKSFNDSGIDSLKSVELMDELENTFNIEFRDKDLGDKTFKSINNFVKVVNKTIDNEKKK